MERYLQLFQTGGIPLVGFALIVALCVVALIAADKVGETLSLLVGTAVAYYLLLSYWYLGEGRIPFERTLVPGGTTILSLLGQDVGGFAGEMLDLFVLVVFLKLYFLVAKPITAWVKGLSQFWGSIAQFLLYYTACTAGMWSYGFFELYVLSALPQGWAGGLAGLVFLLTVLVLLSPVADFIAVAAGLISNPVLKAISKFVKENTLGGALQSTFYATFFSVVLLVILQETGVVVLR